MGNPVTYTNFMNCVEALLVTGNLVTLGNNCITVYCSSVITVYCTILFRYYCIIGTKYYYVCVVGRYSFYNR